MNQRKNETEMIPKGDRGVTAKASHAPPRDDVITQPTTPGHLEEEKRRQGT